MALFNWFLMLYTLPHQVFVYFPGLIHLQFVPEL